MIAVRPAKKNDKDELLKILKEADLYYPSIPLANFFVAEESGRIEGIVQFKEYDDYFFLSSLGVDAAFQGRGVAKALVEKMFESASVKKDKKIYLFTTIPDFFARFGFKHAPNAKNLPPKDLYQCEECFPEKCAPMVKENK